MTQYQVSSTYNPDETWGVVEDGENARVVKGEDPGLEVFMQDVAEYGFDKAMEHWGRWAQFVPVQAVEKNVETDIATGIIAKADDEQRNLFGWAYVALDKDGKVVVDKSGDFMDSVEELEKSAYGFVVKSRQGDLDHTNLKSATMIESMVFTPEKIEKMGIPKGVIPEGAWWIGFHFEDPQDWAEAKKRPSFSIHGTGTRKSVV